jgi:Tfp pilus assembly protein PilP
MLTCTGVLRGQVNPSTPINAARNAAKQQGQTPPPAPVAKQTTPSKPAVNAPVNQASKPAGTKSPATNAATNPPATKPPAAKPPVTNVASNSATKPPAAKPPVSQAQAPPKTATPKTVPPKQAPAKPPAAAAAPPKTPPAKAAAKPEQKPAKPAQTKAAGAPARRDPFVTLVGRGTGGASGPPIKLPPGIGGLQVNTLILQGIVSAPTGMIAVVANPQRSVYFLHVGDKLFDGSVQHIDIGAVTFHEVGKDAFGKPLEREVVRRLNSISGEQP